MADERLEDLLARLERERQAADAAYNEALSALDRALEPRVDLPHPPPPYDEVKIPDVNQAWNILPQGAPPIDGSLKGRLRAFVWRMVGPPLDAQKHFNATVVDHVNRNVAGHRETQKAIASVIALAGQHLERQIHLQAHLIRYLQTITLYVDTKDRAVKAEAQVVNAGLNSLASDWLKRWESLAARDARAAARMALVDDVRDTAAIAQQTALSLKREVEKLLAAPASPAETRRPGESSGPAVDLDSFKYLGFEDAFRGSTDEIRRRLAEYVPTFAGQTDVLDLGCGRGEFLELLKGAGIPARGLDLNHEMVEASRARGLDVVEGDALSYLTSLPDASLGGVFAAQVIEHLEPAYLARLLEASAHKLRPGGVIVLETINPACWVAFFESYLRDLTHVRPLHPETLKYLLRASGFSEITLEFRSPVAEWDRLRTAPKPAGDLPPAVADVIDTVNENVAKLNSRLFTYQDYAAIGRRR
ncbi:MAG TPA: methyltransferase domain-containing protein [Vicinamibacterales bacterium]|nr:methyltransferase domain-containing protein [Vicinamibacterales bacterium]